MFNLIAPMQSLSENVSHLWILYIIWNTEHRVRVRTIWVWGVVHTLIWHECSMMVLQRFPRPIAFLHDQL